MSNYWLKC